MDMADSSDPAAERGPAQAAGTGLVGMGDGQSYAEFMTEAIRNFVPLDGAGG
jgi:hypothetical protein